jgi:heme/copper-type cytochrome/quinol oxidase subunit 2
MTRKKVAVSIAYVAVFLQLATYLARDTGWLSDGGLYTTLLYATSITLLGAVLWLARLRFRSQHEAQPAEPGKGANRIEKQLMAIALLAVVALGVVEVARATGYLSDRNLYVTLNIALPVLFLAMTYEVYLHRKKNSF